MGKQKRSTNSHDDGLSTESCDENQSNSQNSAPECPHVTKSVNRNKLRKIFKSTGLGIEKCSDCSSSSNNSVQDNNSEADKTLWLCLACGSQLCGESKNKHAFLHFKVPRSSSHAIAINTTTFKIFCYSCNNELDAHKTLKDLVELIKKTAEKQRKHSQNDIDNKTKISLEECRTILAADKSPILNSIVPPIPPPPPPALLLPKSGIEKSILYAASEETFDAILPRVRGLTNLGNTCFFNAVLQCLAQTPYLLEVLQESAEAGEEFVLPGGLLTLKNGKEINRPPIKGKLNSWGPITAALAFSLEELQSSGGVFTPDLLFNKFVDKYPQFQGGHQHDSHELLRHLLESVRTEDLQRYQMVILKSIAYKSASHNLIDDETKQKCKAYGLQAADRILRPEQVFRGFLVSTLCCLECNHVSSRHENFLDMSLSVSVEKTQPPYRRKTSPECSQVGPSKHQIKKEKEKLRKEKRALKHQNKKLNSVSLFAGTSGASGDESCNKNENSLSASVSSSEQSDADVEDNLTDDQPKFIDTNETFNHNTPLFVDPNGNNAAPCMLSEGCNSQDDKQKDSNNEDEDDSGIATSPANSGQMVQECVMGDFNETTPVKNIVLELGVGQQGASFIRQLSETAVAQGLEKLTISKNDKDEQHEKIVKKSKRVRTQSHSDWSTTIAPRYQCKDNECSIQSCLNNFTARELMTGKNQVGCDGCTKKTYGEDSSKTAYTNASKQYLISSPPAVLILHLKRFQVEPRGYFRKLGHGVSFSILLDIAPYCGSKIKTLPNIDRKQKQLLYALYGIVEHSGGMHGGHYTAYVKVRPKIDKKNKRWAFIPQGSKSELDQADEHKAKLEQLLEEERNRQMPNKTNDSDDDISEPESENNDDLKSDVGGTEESPSVKVPNGKWYCISDSSVHEVSEATVLKAQAYLLFYERIF